MLRFALPFAAFTAAGGKNSGGETGFPPALAAGLLGLGIAVLIDYVVLAKKTTERPRRDLAWTPTLTVTDGGTSVGLAGRF